MAASDRTRNPIHRKYSIFKELWAVSRVIAGPVAILGAAVRRIVVNRCIGKAFSLASGGGVFIVTSPLEPLSAFRSPHIDAFLR